MNLYYLCGDWRKGLYPLVFLSEFGLCEEFSFVLLTSRLTSNGLFRGYKKGHLSFVTSLWRGVVTWRINPKETTNLNTLTKLTFLRAVAKPHLSEDVYILLLLDHAFNKKKHYTPLVWTFWLKKNKFFSIVKMNTFPPIMRFVMEKPA